jgi:hypothetical protein
LPFSPYSSCAYVGQTLVMFVVTFAASYYLYVNYAADRRPHVLVISGVAAVFVAAGGIWANANAAAGSPVPTLSVYWYEWLIWGLIGVGVGIGYVAINYGARPASARSGTQMLCWILLFGGIGVVLYLGRLKGVLVDPPPDFVAVAAVGGLVGISELVSRYRDEPTKALFTMPAVLYVALNATAAILALGLGSSLVTEPGEPGPLGVRWALVLGCGISAMAILRSALFVVRTDGKDLQVGLGSLVQTLLDAADRSLDRLRAEERAWTVAKLMEHLMSRETPPDATGFRARLGGARPRERLDDEIVRLVVIEAVALLPNYCIALTQNLDAADRETFLDAVKPLTDNTSMSDEVKLFTLGLLIMNAVGPKVLDAAVSSLANDMIERARVRARAEAEVQSVKESADQTMQRAQETADAARKAADAAGAEGTSPAVQDAAAQMVASADLTATSATATDKAASGLVKTVADVLEHPLTPAVASDTAEAAGQAAGPSTNGAQLVAAGGAASSDAGGPSGGTPGPG